MIDSNGKEYRPRIEYPKYIGGTESKLPYDLSKLNEYIKIAKPWEREMLLLLARHHEQSAQLESAESTTDKSLADFPDMTVEVLKHNLQYTNEQLDKLKSSHESEWLTTKSTLVLTNLESQLFGGDKSLKLKDEELPRRTSSESTILTMAEAQQPLLKAVHEKNRKSIKKYGHPSLVRMTVALALNYVPEELTYAARSQHPIVMKAMQ
jgi:hypothetical protein